MTKYKKIWIPISKVPKNWEDDAEAFVHKGNTIYMTARQNSIVLTIEELRVLWDAARLHESEALRKPYANREMLKEPDFETYLKSKGIQL